MIWYIVTGVLCFLAGIASLLFVVALNGISSYADGYKDGWSAGRGGSSVPTD